MIKQSDPVKLMVSPDNLEIEVAPQANLMTELAKVGVMLTSPCGGEGTCQKCRVIASEGQANFWYPEIVYYCLDKLFDLAYQNTLRIYEQIPDKVMLSYVAEDLGGQEGLMFSLDHIREFLLPGMKRIVDLAHSTGAYVFHHNDGAIRDVIPDMVDLGIDILNPIQWRCEGMDREWLKRDFGKDLVFHGGIDN